MIISFKRPPDVGSRWKNGNTGEVATITAIAEDTGNITYRVGSGPDVSSNLSTVEWASDTWWRTWERIRPAEWDRPSEEAPSDELAKDTA